MALTYHLTDRASPVRAFFAERFPHTRSLWFKDSGRPARALHTPTSDGDLKLYELDMIGRQPALVLPSEETAFPWALAGSALDYRLRFELERTDLGATSAAKGWAEVCLLNDRRDLEPDGGVWAELREAIATVPTPGRSGSLTRRQELDLANYCAVLGMYEQVYRMGGLTNRAVWEHPVVTLGPTARLTTLRGLVDERLATDVADMIGLARERAPALVSASDVLLGPGFARSRDLGGADADLIVDRALVEVKATKRTQLPPRVVWQVLGYLLADTDDEHRLEHVGWYFARHGLTWQFPVAEFCTRLAGGAAVDLAAERSAFARICRDLRERRRAERQAAAAQVAESNAHAARWWPTPERRVDWALGFLRPATGSGRWHAPAGSVPFLASSSLPRDPLAPACGSPVSLEDGGEALVPPLGVLHADVDGRVCRRCVQYTEAFYAKRLQDPRPEEHELADVPYRAPASGGAGRWHVRSGDTRWSRPETADRPNCGASVTLDLSGPVLRVPPSGLIEDADPRLCRRCLQHAAAPSDPTKS